MKTLLISGIGGPTPRSIARVVRKCHPDISIVGIDANPLAVGFYMKQLLDFYYVSPKASDENYWDFILRIIDKHQVDYAIIQPEKEIIAWGDYWDCNGSYPCPVFIPSKKLAQSLMDKSIMADLLKDTEFIPKTIKVTQDDPKFDQIENLIGFPCWIRATQGSGGLGSLKLKDISSYRSWLFINNEIQEFTVSEFLPGRHLANQMLYYDNCYVKGAALQCVEYVMANVAPSKVTGNTSYGRLLNEDRINIFCDECIKYICKQLGIPAHGVLSFDLKEDVNGNLKVTEVNIRHMAYTGIMAQVGFNLVSDTINILECGNASRLTHSPYYHYDKPYVFLRDVDIEPIILDDSIILGKQ